MLNAGRIMIQTMITLASASLGLVAALAWNEAIKATITAVFGTGDSLAALYTYAIFGDDTGDCRAGEPGPPRRSHRRLGDDRARGRRLSAARGS